MAKADLQAAYRQCPVLPVQYPSLGFKWRNQFYYDKVLPMGCRSSCTLFQRISDCLLQFLRRASPSSLAFNILDDFLFLGPPESAVCADAYFSFLAICETINFPVKPEKCTPPTTCLVFLGVTIDTVKQELRLPQSKILKMQAAIDLFLQRPRTTLHRIQALGGLLNFAVVAIPAGRIFLRRLYQLAVGLRSPSASVYIPVEVRLDLEVWSLFLRQFNGRSLFSPRDRHADFHVHSDAAGGIGFGLMCGTEWSYGVWPADAAPWSITFKELFPVFVACLLWGPRWRHAVVSFTSDNQAVVAVLNRLSCNDTRLAALMRRIVGLLLRFNILIHAVHIPGTLNSACDALSRLQVNVFRRLVPSALPFPVPLPRAASPLPFCRL
jgi:hypothetical protein